MLDIKSVLIILAVSCISRGPVQDSCNAKVIRAERDWDYYDTLPKTEDLGIEDFEDDQVMGIGEETSIEFTDPDDYETASVQKIDGMANNDFRMGSESDEIKYMLKSKVTEIEEDPADFEIAPVQETEQYNDDDIRPGSFGNAVSNASRKWPNGTVPYIIASRHSRTIRNVILASMREIEQDVNGAAVECVKFIPRTNEYNYIKIVRATSCKAGIGMLNKGIHTVAFSPGCHVKIRIMHELLHVLGFWHEHMRYDRDTYININMTNVKDGHQKNFNIAPVGMADTLNTSYDFSSIMHYCPYTFAKDRTIPVITPKPGQAGGIKLGQYYALSNSDVIRIQRLYNCTEDISHIRRRYLTDSLAMCDFANGMCNLTDDANATVPWEIIQGRSASGPQAGNTDGADPYLVAVGDGRRGTARLRTPLYNISTDFCVDFFRFQRGPSSYIKVAISGPLVPRRVLTSYRGRNNNAWTRAKLYMISPPNGAHFLTRVTFTAHMRQGDVAIDDLNIYKGACY